MSPPSGRSGVLVEVCVGSLAEALDAQRAGADRVELCAGLPEGGTTPSAGTIVEARRRLDLDLCVMIRPRGGDFLYSAGELASMERDIEVARDAGADGVVLGALHSNGEVDLETVARLCAAAAPLPVTFHRAFDVARDPLDALGGLARAGVRRVLTSGLEGSVVDGIETLTRAVERAAGAPAIVAACGRSGAADVARVVGETGATEVHVYAPAKRPGPMAFRRADVPMGMSYEPDDYSSLGASVDALRDLIARLTDEPTGH